MRQAVKVAALISLKTNALHYRGVCQASHRAIRGVPAKLEAVSVLIWEGMYSLLTPILWVCGF